MRHNYLYLLGTIWLFISCSQNDMNYIDNNSEVTTNYEIIDLCDGNSIKLPIDLGFKPLMVKFSDSCIYTASDSNNINLLIDYNFNKNVESKESFINRRQISTMSMLGITEFSETKEDFFQNHLTLSYSAESASDSTHIFVKNFYWIVDLQKKEYLTFHFQSRSSNIKFSEILSDKALKVMSSFIFESKAEEIRHSQNPTEE